MQADVERKIALNIAEAEWEFVDPAALPEPGTYSDFPAYVNEKIWIGRTAAAKNLGGFIVEAIRSNYQNPELQKQREAEKERERQAMLDALKAERDEKVRVLIQQAVREQPHLLEAAAEKLPSFVRRRLEDSDSVEEAYKVGGIVTGTINAILAEELCTDLIAPVLQIYEDEKAKILEER